MADLETPTPPAPAAETPAPPPDPAATPPAPESAAPDAEEIPEGAIEQAGQVMVPLAALKAEREQVKTLKGKAQQYDQVAGWYQQSRPYIDFLQAHPDLLTRSAAAASPGAAPTAPPPAPSTDDAAAETFARTLDLYTPDGKPDVARAKTVMAAVDAIAEKKAQAVVKPVQELTLQDRAMANYHEAARAVAPNGAKVDPNVLWNIWQQGDPRVLASPQGAAAAWALALGMQAMQLAPQAGPAPPSQPPVLTEPAGSRLMNRAPITELDQRVINVRGMDPKKYAEYAKAFKPGEANTLEE